MSRAARGSSGRSAPASVRILIANSTISRALLKAWSISSFSTFTSIYRQQVSWCFCSNSKHIGLVSLDKPLDNFLSDTRSRSLGRSIKFNSASLYILFSTSIISTVNRGVGFQYSYIILKIFINVLISAVRMFLAPCDTFISVFLIADITNKGATNTVTVTDNYSSTAYCVFANMSSRKHTALHTYSFLVRLWSPICR